MIESTFVLLKGIGEATERRWWEAGLSDWSIFRRRATLAGMSRERKRWYDIELGRAEQALADRDSRYFAGCLRPRDHWRLLPTFRDQAVFLDIETTGGDPEPGSVTVVGLHAGDQCLQLVEGTDLDASRLNEVLAAAPMLITFFGSVFDIPYLKRVFPSLRTPPLHVDLCFVARRVGLTGGLKQIEATLGLTRDTDLVGLDGWDAVQLWRAWQMGSVQALDRLLRYNRADTLNLSMLAIDLYDRLVKSRGPVSLSSAPA